MQRLLEIAVLNWLIQMETVISLSQAVTRNQRFWLLPRFLQMSVPILNANKSYLVRKTEMPLTNLSMFSPICFTKFSHTALLCGLFSARWSGVSFAMINHFIEVGKKRYADFVCNFTKVCMYHVLLWTNFSVFKIKFKFLDHLFFRPLAK